MNAELELAWNIINTTGVNLFLTGKAGTGKTTFLKELGHRSFKRMIVLAPTGIAAINAGGVTIHSFFQFPLSPYIPGATFDHAENKHFRFSKMKINIIRTVDLLVIDEISMVRADLLDAIDAVMRRYRSHNKPFGGVQLLMIGDLQQLSPVVKDTEWTLLNTVYETPYFFSSKALKLSDYHTVELREVYRQQDMEFVRLLNQIRGHDVTDEVLTLLNSRYIPDFKPDKENDFVCLTTHNCLAQKINDRELGLLPSKEYTFRAEIKGAFPESSYPADKQLVLKKDAQVMFIKNDPDKRFYNGMIGEVVFVSDKEIWVRNKKKQDEAFKLDKSEWTNSKYTLDNVSKEIKETVDGVFRQYPLRLAWAITVHKSQGLTFDHAIIDVSHSFAHGQTYVALSRCKTLEGIVLSSPLSRKAIISDDTLNGFISDMESKVPTDKVLLNLQIDYIVQLLDELFDFRSLQSAFTSLLRTLEEYFYRKCPKLLTEYERMGTLFDNLINISIKFKTQYTRILTDNPNTDNLLFQERIHKAANYFLEKLGSFHTLCGKTKINTENQFAKKQFKARFEIFYNELALKKSIFEYECRPDKKFSVSDYLKIKNEFLLKQDKDVQDGLCTRETKRREDYKKIKTPTHQVSFDMFSKGMSLAQIADKRRLAESTVFRHLAFYVKSGMLDIENLVTPKHLRDIRTYTTNNPDVTAVSDIKAAVDPTITYDEIRLVMG